MPDFTHDPSATFTAQRLLPAKPNQVFAAFKQPDVLAKWWGPDGFTNTFQQFDFVPGGDWISIMHGPDGADHHNIMTFRELVPGRRIVVEHVVQPPFLLTITFTPQDGGTLLTWQQEFESPDMAERLRAICVPANEQVLNRLQAVLNDSGVSAV